MVRLEGMQRADAAIVGGGLAGLLLAASLTQSGMRVAIVDAADGSDAPASGAASLLSAPVFMRIEAAHGVAAAQQYADGLSSQLHAMLAAPLPYVRETPVYAYAETEADLPALEDQHRLLTSLRVPVSIAPDAGGCPFPVALSMTVQGALVDIPRWMSALQASILRRCGRIFTDSRVIAIDSTRVYTQQGCVEAPHVILTTGKPLGLRSRRILALLESRVVAHCELTAPFPLHSCQLPVRESGFSLHPTVWGAVAALDAGRAGTPFAQESLLRFPQMLHSYLPDWQPGEIRHSQAVRSADGLPIIGTLLGSRVLCASGYSGILGAMHAAEALTRRILGHALPEDAMYAPDRAVPQSILRPELRRISGMYARNMLRRSAPACAHCACRLRYSTAAQRWECPYCGTCYTMLGRVICGPGMRSAQVSVRQRPDM